MRISYDKQIDALAIVFRDTTVTTEEVADGISMEYDADGKLAGIEILDAMKRFADKDTLDKIVFEGVGPAHRAAA